MRGGSECQGPYPRPQHKPCAATPPPTHAGGGRSASTARGAYAKSSETRAMTTSHAPHRSMGLSVAKRCKVLPGVALALWRVAPRCMDVARCCRVLQRVAPRCQAVQGVAPRCTALQGVTGCCNGVATALQRVAPRCTALQRVATRCKVLHCVATCCTALQGVAGC